MAFLNYHHLRYFRAIAQAGSMSKAALNLSISQSALSIQLRQLEDTLGRSLFERKGRGLVLTEAGRMTLDFANVIFRTGEELMDTLRQRGGSTRKILRIGAVATLSRNFQFSVLERLLNRSEVELVVRTGALRELLNQLENHTLDVVLSNLPVRRDADTGWHSHLLDQQAVSLVGRPVRGGKPLQFPDDLRKIPLLLPSLDSNIRASFDQLMEQAGIRPVIAAEVDDMAMLRLLARGHNGLTLVPPVVVRGELQNGTLVERHQISQIKESFYAITPTRRFPNPLVRELILSRKS
jgi:LysR family transcriptional activator of nhaA